MVDDPTEIEFRRGVAEARVGVEPDFLFTTWFVRLVMTLGLVLLSVLVAVVLLLLQFQNSIDDAHNAINENAAITSGLNESAYKNRAAQCEIIAALHAPIPPSCLEDRVLKNLPAELRNQSPFNGEAS